MCIVVVVCYNTSDVWLMFEHVEKHGTCLYLTHFNWWIHNKLDTEKARKVLVMLIIAECFTVTPE